MIKLNSDGDFMESVTARFEETVAFYSSVIDEGKMIFCGAELNDQKMDMDGVIFKMTLPVTISKRYVYPRNTALKEPVVSIYDLFGRHINSGKYSRKNSSGIYVVTGEKKRSIVSVNLRNSGNGTNVFPLHPSF
ncbi:MAG: hypothetical protein GX089_03725 [Fibrobacter sp.]|nr:hypothetical protein [Fibrobacter sp.]